eukprot:CAMPEP_0175261774 /NCGR_PEP_ID=MMETSP0093-20121207/40933_1 /TAXON_ID=311494 /ORGANISM="Alexandrium monilatum, Strain CCMP3105" /LENGTH=49 /DNA_ID= /DNA_START= /DNA_END= /DNA_ORIENTATION=
MPACLSPSLSRKAKAAGRRRGASRGGGNGVPAGKAPAPPAQAKGTAAMA